MTLPDWLEAEDDLCNRMVAALAAMADDEETQKLALSNELRALFEQRAEACNDVTQQQAIDEAIDELERRRTHHDKTHRTRDLDRGSPYFGHLVLDEDDKQRQLLIAKGSAVDSRLPVNVVDWRNAPISRIYYEFEEGEEFWVEVAGREREGVVTARRTLDIRAGVLQSAETRELVARKREGNQWTVLRKADEALERSDQREDPEDHALPDIVALITPDQFQVLTRPDRGVVVLRGQAGSGKTTVALHRIAYLHYHDRQRFRLDRVLVVMFNKALQTYIRRALKDLDIEGVQVSTFHAWASRMLRTRGPLRFGGKTPPAVATFKQHPAIEGLLQRAVARLGERLEAWLPVPEELAAAWEATEGSGLARVGAYLAEAATTSDGEGLRRRVFARLHDAKRDLFGMLDEVDAADLPQPLRPMLPTVHTHLERQKASGELDFADAALLLRLGQLVAEQTPGFTVPWYQSLAHIVVDEAQDLSAPAIRVMLDAADVHRSITLAGDPAQTLYDAGEQGVFSAATAGLGDVLQLDELPVGHRSTRPIMELALAASGHSDPALLDKTRPGHPVTWLEGDDATVEAAAKEIDAFRSRRPSSLVAVLTRTKSEADRWSTELESLLPGQVRRGHREDFGFQPGVVVSNVHQVKGLEFDGVVLVEPASYANRDRNLLHVAVTRAADQLWVVARRSRGHLAT
ncbi:MAG: ATP-binding domain-containing protein [Myxococcales bacterium]|nr:ATP-binding domain-containing protein [Myxococcales bacterium]